MGTLLNVLRRVGALMQYQQQRPNFKSMGQDGLSQKRILEINPSHSMFEFMNTMLTSGADEQVQEYIDFPGTVGGADLN
jgi:hypothetical protein